MYQQIVKLMLKKTDSVALVHLDDPGWLKDSYFLVADLAHIQELCLVRDVDRVHICQFLLSVHRHLEHVLRWFQLKITHNYNHKY